MVFGMRINIPAETCSPRVRGFSLIEAVVVISLLGIVGAFAVPRFTRLANVVRSSEVQALGVYLQDTAQAAHEQYLASGSHISTAKIAGRTVALENGYPDASADGIRKAVFTANGFTAAQAGAFVTFRRADAPLKDQCAVTYRLPQNGGAATMTMIVTSGC
jgi:MSHA pilin protein MshA